MKTIPFTGAAYRYYTLDVFTDHVFGGNPLAVFPDARGLTTEQMQRITVEFNLSETVFVLPPEDAAHARRLRIFTPGRELPFAGHPTVGTAFLLAVTGMIALTEGETHIILGEGVGPVPVTVFVRSGVPVSARLTAAQLPDIRRDVPSVGDVASLLSLNANDVGTPELDVAAVSCGVPFLLVPLKDRTCVSRARAQGEIWDRLLSEAWAREIYLFDGSAVTNGTPIRARMFAPGLGIGEDPATGSAAVALAGYLAMHDRSDAPRLKWTVEQGVEMGRPSTLELSADQAGGQVIAVHVAGSAVLVSEGTIYVPDA